ncbi:MAG: SDR family oxidoreductase [Gammaproteobacteria bacterium]|nr:SDR family oxidoreductase [Gammaproteobacteria bacterium]
MRLAGKVALVTGAGRGIGAAIAAACAREGARVVVADLDAAPAQDVAEALCKAGGAALPLTMDVTDRSQIEAALDAAVAAFGHIDILVNNAGVSVPAMIETMTPAQWDTALAVNLTGVFHCTQIVGRHFLARARAMPAVRCNGKIVNVTSIAGLRGTIGQINYAAAKAGVLGITMSAAREWGRYAVNVNCVACGLVETRMTETIRTDPRFADQYRKQIVLGRYAAPDDVAPAVVFFASADADYVTGQILNVCGGADIHV